jgi:site-specific DNA-methyltransferase (adenine-specific)
VTPRNTVLTGDALTMLRTLAAESVDAVITSPPYLLARDYGSDGQLGQEANVDEWVANLRAVSREIARVLAPTGSYWLNVGDLYSTHARLGAPRKSLLLAPERLVRALLDDGWLVRNKIVYSKTNPLPTHVADRLRVSWEPVFHLVRRADYWYDLDAIRIPLKTPHKRGSEKVTPAAARSELAGTRGGLVRMATSGWNGHPLGRNPGDVWHLPTGRRRGAHFATFPEALVRRPILATAPLHVCRQCGRPWRRSRRSVQFLAGVPQPRPLVPCGCEAPTRPGLVLDPFSGSGTTLAVAVELRRDFLGIELNQGYAQQARERALEAA